MIVFSNYWKKQKPVFSWASFYLCIWLFVYKKVKVRRKWKAVVGWPGDTSLLLLCTAHCSVGPRLRPNNHVRICVWHFCSYRVFLWLNQFFFFIGWNQFQQLFNPIWKWARGSKSVCIRFFFLAVVQFMKKISFIQVWWFVT